MVNSQVIKEISNSLKIDERVEKIPSAIPVIEVGPKKCKTDIVKSTNIVNATSGTIYTTPTTADFYITWASIYARINGGTTITYSINATIGGISTDILLLCNIAGLATTAGPLVYSGNAIKIDRGTNITLTTNAAEATTRISGSIIGYLDEVT
jgi:hypothetical protein